MVLREVFVSAFDILPANKVDFYKTERGCMRGLLRALKTNVVSRFLFYLYIRVLFTTYRLRVVDESGSALPLNRSEGLYYIWHQNLIAGLFFLYKEGVYGHLISDFSVEGVIGGFIARKFGLKVVTKSKATSFMRKVLDVLEMNKRIYMVGDEYKKAEMLQRHIPYLCARTKVPMRFIECSASSALSLKQRWDRFKIPLPFSTITIKITKPRSFAFDAQHEVVET